MQRVHVSCYIRNKHLGNYKSEEAFTICPGVWISSLFLPDLLPGSSLHGRDDRSHKMAEYGEFVYEKKNTGCYLVLQRVTKACNN